MSIKSELQDLSGIVKNLFKSKEPQKVEKIRKIPRYGQMTGYQFTDVKDDTDLEEPISKEQKEIIENY